MLDSFNSMFSKFKSAKLVSTVTDNYNKLKHIVMKKINITLIIPQLFHIDYPQEINAEQLAQHTNNAPYQIWNISQYRYEDKFEQTLKKKAPLAQIHHLCYQYYSNIPFYELVEAIQNIKAFLANSPSHQVYVHCQDSKVRSAVFLAAYIFQTRAVQVQDISEAIIYVNKRLQMHLQDQKGSISSSYKNHHRLFKNLMNYHTNPQFINPHSLLLQTIKINNAPNINIKGANPKQTPELKMVIEVRNGQSILFKGIFSEAVTPGETICVNFEQQTKQIVLSDEFLVMVKYSRDKKVYNMFRIQLNTNFIFQQFTRVHQQDIDVSVHCVTDKKHLTFIDFTFKEQKGTSKLAGLVLGADKKEQRNVDLLSDQAVDAKIREQCFALEAGDEPHELDQNQLSLKIEQVMKSMTLKEEQQQEDIQEQEEEDLEDYLSKLESLA